MPSREWRLRIFGIDLPTVWKTIQDDLPPLKAQLNEILRDAGGEK